MSRLSASSLLFFFVCSAMVACTESNEVDDHAPSIATTSSPPAAAPPTTAGGERARVMNDPPFPTGPTPRALPFSCRAGAFCEDFESSAWQAHWSDVVGTGGSGCERLASSASPGNGSLHCHASEGLAAFALEPLRDVGPSWHGVFSFAVRADALPATTLGGPELLVKTDEGPVTIRVVFGVDGLAIEQFATDACRPDRCPSLISTPSATPKPGTWTHVTLGIEANATSGPSYGRIEATIDGGDLQTIDLAMPAYGGSMFFRAGVTSGDGPNSALDLDDISLLVK